MRNVIGENSNRKQLKNKLHYPLPKKEPGLGPQNRSNIRRRFYLVPDFLAMGCGAKPSIKVGK